MNIHNIIARKVPPEAWSDGENIPWNDPDFSKRMLVLHLNQNHDLASRRFDIIDQHVKWIHEEILGGTPTRILELACGPGFYTSRLAQLGHECVGIDYAPESIRYAQKTATREGLACTYRLEDVRKAKLEDGYGLVMMIFGQLNVFRRDEARSMAHKCLPLPHGHRSGRGKPFRQSGDCRKKVAVKFEFPQHDLRTVCGFSRIGTPFPPPR